MTEAVTRILAAHAAGAAQAGLSPDVADRVGMILFDEIGCALVGRRLDPGVRIAAWVAAQGGHPVASMLGTGGMTTTTLAALANGTAGHADEFDGAHMTDGHPGAVIVHAALAMAEAEDAPGQSLATAVALGYDIGTRIVAAVGGAFSLRQRHHIHSDHLHTYGAATAAGLILGFDADGQRQALALCAGNAGGLATVFEEPGHMTKALSTGQGAMAGVMAAELVRHGFTGHDDVLESRHGPLAWAETDGQIDLASLGRDAAVMGANFKFYSAGYPIHAPVEGALVLMAENGLAPDDLAEIAIGMNSGALDTVHKRAMKSIDLAHMVAVAIVHGGLGFEVAHDPAALDHPAVAGVKTRIVIAADPELDRTQPRGRGARMTLTTRDGRRLSRLIEHPRGYALRGPVSWDDLAGKWERLLPERIGAARARDFLAACRAIITLASARDLTRILEGR